MTEAQAADTVVVPWNDREAVERALAEREVAALVCEPYPANMGLVPPEPGFLDVPARGRGRGRRAARVRRGDLRLPGGAAAARRSARG